MSSLKARTVWSGPSCVAELADAITAALVT
jgi:hypothetical protein